jgi:hypothetical protein
MRRSQVADFPFRDQPFSDTTRLLRRHPANNCWRHRQPRDAVEDRREQVRCDRPRGQLKGHRPVALPGGRTSRTPNHSTRPAGGFAARGLFPGAPAGGQKTGCEAGRGSSARRSSGRSAERLPTARQNIGCGRIGCGFDPRFYEADLLAGQTVIFWESRKIFKSLNVHRSRKFGPYSCC